MKKPIVGMNRRTFLTLAAVGAAGLLYSVKSGFTNNQLIKKLPKRAAVKPNARLGMNLAGINDWSTELPFVDLFKMSRPWISQRKDTAWGQGPQLDLDEHGNVKRLDVNCHATAVVCSVQDNHYPSGEYVLLYEGEGEFSFHSAADASSVIESTPGRILFNLDATKGIFNLNLLNTNPDNHVRNVRIIMPGFESVYQSNPWNPDFLRRWEGISCLRFMDFMMTNNSPQMIWDDRPKLTDTTYADKGAPAEMLVDLANRLDVDPWFCMPHLANDHYMQQFAQIVKDSLNPNLRAWIEYSNEVWNGQFRQNQYAAQLGESISFLDEPHEAAWKFYAKRSLEMFNIWQSVIGDDKRMVRVLASQAANVNVTQTILQYQNAAASADVLAVAPYMDFNVTPNMINGINDEIVSKWSVDHLFEQLTDKVLPQSISWMQQSKKMADDNGLKLVTYEAGQHLLGVLGAENNEKLTNLLTQANSDPRMGQLYTEYLAAWTQMGGDLMCVFSSTSSWSKWGYWSILRYHNEPIEQAPKFKACIDWAVSRGQKMHY